jgi:NAD(P)-dependent dehydrogenase (short-subunit alcohol dehydrogenase family)
VQAFAAAGARVVMADVDASGDKLATQLGPDRCRFIRADISDEAAVADLVTATVETYQSIDVLVNNAAVMVPTAPLHETSLAEFERLTAVNLRGLFYCCKHAYRHLKRSRGCIINVSSMAGVNGEQGHAVYAATKGAVNALTKSMAVDYGADGIRCNAVCPSSVLTPAVDNLI